MSRWRLVLELADGREPRYLRIARAVVADIRRGRLRPGDALPGTRGLADELAVHRNTVKAAYAELVAQGWITARPSSGTFVSDRLPEPNVMRPTRPASESRVGFTLPPMHLPEVDTWSHLAAADIAFQGVDAELFPRAALSRAYRHALASSRDVLGYRLGRGHPRLLAALDVMLTTVRGIAPGRPLLVTRGSQMALDLIVRALFRTGDAVAIEDPGYAFAWPALRAAGIELVPIPVDRDGLDVDHLASLLGGRSIRGVLVTPHAQYPTGVTLSAGRRMRLLDLARRHRFIVIEDDFVHEIRFDGRPILPLASVDTSGTVLYLGSFSKTFAPSVRIGFVAGPEPVIERLARLRARVDVCGDAVTELAMANLLEDGEVPRHVRRLTRTLRRRRDVLAEELDRRLGATIRVATATGGSALWVEVDPSIDTEAWARAGIARGVGFLTARHFFLDERARPFLWLPFGGLTEARLALAVARMARALAEVRRGPQRR